jgi:hypothetical protein
MPSTSEYGATSIQIEKEWTKSKGVILLYKV